MPQVVLDSGHIQRYNVVAMPRKPQPIAVTFSLPKPVYQYVLRRAEREFGTIEATLRRVVLEAMQNDPIERAAAAAIEAMREEERQQQEEARKLAVKEAERAARDAEREAVHAARSATKDAERAARDAAKEAARAARLTEREALRAEQEAARAERDALRAAVIAEKLAKKQERLSPNVEISDDEVYEARQLIHKFPPTMVHGKSATGYKGVEQYNSKFRAAITLMGVRRHLGVFGTPADAARAYDAMCRRVYGKKALLNFPNNLELSAKDGRQRVVIDGKEGWRAAPSTSSLPLPKPIPGLPNMTMQYVPDGKGSWIEPPGERDRRNAIRMQMIMEQLEKDTIEAGLAWDDSDTGAPIDPGTAEEEERRLRDAARNDLPADWHEPPPQYVIEPIPVEEPAHEPVAVEDEGP